MYIWFGFFKPSFILTFLKYHKQNEELNKMFQKITILSFCLNQSFLYSWFSPPSSLCPFPCHTATLHYCGVICSRGGGVFCSKDCQAEADCFLVIRSYTPSTKPFLLESFYAAFKDPVPKFSFITWYFVTKGQGDQYLLSFWWHGHRFLENCKWDTTLLSFKLDYAQR